MPPKTESKALARTRKPKAPAGKPVVSKPDQRDILASTVRPTDEQPYFTQRTPVIELVQRYGGYIKVAASRNASGVASTPLRVYRKTTGGKSAFAGRSIKRHEANRLAMGVKAAAQLGDDIEEVIDPLHPLVKLLREVNIRDNGFGLIEDTEVALGLTGNAYWCMVYQPGTPWPVELWPFKPQSVRCIPDRERFVSGYVYGRGYENEQTFDAEDVIHFRRPNPLDDYYGRGDLQACLIHADISIDLALFWRAALNNACQPGLVISGEGVNAKTREQIQEAVDKRMRGVNKAAITAVLEGNVKVDKWAMDKQDFSNLEGSESVMAFIAACFDQPVELMTLRPGGIGDSGGSALRLWQEFGIKPRVKRLEDQVNAKLVPVFRRVLGDDTLFVAFDNPVAEDENANVDRAVRLFAANLYDRDKALGTLGEDAVDGRPVYAIDLTTQAAIASLPPTPDATDGQDGATEGPAAGDAPTAPQTDVQATALNGAQVAALQELVRAAAAKEIPLEAVEPSMLIAFPNTPPDLIARVVESLRGFEPPKPDPVAVTGAIPPPVPPGGVDPKESVAVSVADADPVDAKGAGRLPPVEVKSLPYIFVDDPHDHGQKDDVRPRAVSAGFFDDMAHWFQTIQPAVDSVANAPTVAKMQADAAAILQGDEAAFDRLLRALEPHTREAYRNGNNIGVGQMEELGIQGAAERWDIPPQGAINFLETYDARLADSIIATVQEKVRDTIGREVSDSVAASLTEGETLAQAQARLKEVMGPKATEFAAERIARTETSRAVGMGKIESYRESGDVGGIEWIASGDPCPVCADLAGKVVGVGEPFIVTDYGPVLAPPAHPQCVLGDCAVLPGTTVAAFRAWYSGNIVSVRTASGGVLTVTENHPVLTARGFVPAGQVHKGDNLVRACRTDSAVGPDEHNRPATALQVFQSLRMSRGVASYRVPTAPEHFHGDGRSIDGQVDVVAADSLLWSGGNAAPPEHGGQCPFCGRVSNDLSLAGQGDLDAMLLCLRLAADSGVSGGSLPLAVLAGGGGEEEADGFAASAVLESGGPEAIGDSGSADAEAFGNVLDGLAGSVARDEVVGIEVKSFHGWVYNLSTVSGCYVADGFIIHNCNCSDMPVAKETSQEVS